METGARSHVEGSSVLAPSYICGHLIWLNLAEVCPVDPYSARASNEEVPLEMAQRAVALAPSPSCPSTCGVTADLLGGDPRYQALLEEAGITW